MTYSAFKNVHPAQFIGSSILLLPIFIAAYFAQTPELNNSFPSLLAFYVEAPLWGLILGFVGVLINSFFLSYTLNKHEIFKPKTFLPFLSYGLVLGFYPANLQASSLLVATGLLFWALNKCLFLAETQASPRHMLEASFFIGIASLFFWPAIFMLPMVLVAAIINGLFLPRNVALTVIGFLGPWFFAKSICYLLDWSFSLPSKWKSPDISIFFNSTPALIILGFSFIVIPFGLYFFFKSLEKLTVEHRNKKRILGIAFLSWILPSWSVFVTPVNGALFFVIYTPIMALAFCTFLYYAKWKPLVIFTGILTLVVYLSNFKVLLNL